MTTLRADSAAAAHTTACSHCGLPVPAALQEAGATDQFCCHGCRTVHGIIRSEGLGAYYPMRRSLETERAPASGRDTDYAAFDEPAFRDRYTTQHEDGTTSATLSVEGLHCAACVWLIERLGRVVPGVLSATVHYGRATVDVRWETGRAVLSEVARGLDRLGYPASPPRTGSRDEMRRSDARAQLVRIGVAGAIAGNVMLVAIALYAGVFDGMDKNTFTFFRWVSAGLGMLSLAWPGRVFFRGAWAALRARAPHLDLPIALALATGGVWGLANTVRGTGEIYFDSLCTLVFLLLVGRFIQSQQQRRAADAVDLLLTVAPSMVRVVDEHGERLQKPTEAVEIGDTAEVLAGETVPVDGVISRGESELDRSVLTGESAPVGVGPGDGVYAGDVNLSGVVLVRTTAVGDTARAARLMRLVADASAQRAPVVQLADKLAGWFVVLVALLAGATAALWWSLGSPEAGIEHATALLIVTCPCALGLATPLVLSATIGRLAKAGVLVKGGVQLERLATPGTAVLDKTGTVTTGAMSVTDWSVPEATAARVRALEACSTHPIARAIAASGPRTPGNTEDVVSTKGLGIAGTVDGDRLAVGSDTFLHSLGVDVPGAVRRWAWERACAGETPVLIAENGAVSGGVALSDTLRDDAASCVHRLREAGWAVELLSGDDPRAVARTAEQLGLDPAHAKGRVTPEGKLEHVRSLVERGSGPVVMIGDGVNDTAALAAADVGIAVQGGADASLDAADILVQRGGLGGIEALTRSASGAMHRIRVCIGASLCYNAVAAGLGIGGLIHPLLAAVLMPLSSLTVVAIAASGRLADPARVSAREGAL